MATVNLFLLAASRQDVLLQADEAGHLLGLAVATAEKLRELKSGNSTGLISGDKLTIRYRPVTPAWRRVNLDRVVPKTRSNPPQAKRDNLAVEGMD